MIFKRVLFWKIIPNICFFYWISFIGILRLCLLNSYQVLEKFIDSVITEFWAVHSHRKSTIYQEHLMYILYIPFSFLVWLLTAYLAELRYSL